MGGLDWIIGAVFIVSILVGIMRGFIKESLSIVSWIAAIWLAVTFCVAGGDFLGQYIDIPNQKFRTWAGFALIFISTLFIFAIVSYAIVKFFAHGAIKSTDRVLGIGFGALRAAAIVVAFIIITRGLGMNNNEWWKNSQYLPLFEPVSAYVEELLPEDWRTTEGDGQEEQTIKEQVIEGVINNIAPSSTGTDSAQ